MIVVLPHPFAPAIATSCAPSAKRSRSSVRTSRPRPSRMPRKPLRVSTRGCMASLKEEGPIRLSRAAVFSSLRIPAFVTSQTGSVSKPSGVHDQQPGSSNSRNLRITHFGPRLWKTLTPTVLDHNLPATSVIRRSSHLRLAAADPLRPVGLLHGRRSMDYFNRRLRGTRQHL